MFNRFSCFKKIVKSLLVKYNEMLCIGLLVNAEHVWWLMQVNIHSNHLALDPEGTKY